MMENYLQTFQKYDQLITMNKEIKYLNLQSKSLYIKTAMLDALLF